MVLFGLLALAALTQASLNPVRDQALSVSADDNFESQVDFYSELYQIVEKIEAAKSKTF